jgi:hypothetical protein
MNDRNGFVADRLFSGGKETDQLFRNLRQLLPLLRIISQIAWR